MTLYEIINNNLNVFTHTAEDVPLTKRRKYIDIVLSIFFWAAVFLYSLWEARNVFDSEVFEGACYSTGQALPGGDTALKVKHLCYTKEVSKEWQGFALKTYTCRGEHGGTYWGFAEDSSTGAGDAGSNNGGGGAGGNNGGQPPNNNGGQPPNNNGGRLLSGAGMMISPDQQPNFCSKVIHSGESEIKAFASKQMHDNCVGDGCQPNVDTSRTYTKLDCSGNSCGYYVRTGTQPDGMTCCGMRVQGMQNRILGWLGAIGGFSGLLLSFIAIFPPYSAKSEEETLEEAGLTSVASTGSTGSTAEIRFGKRATE